MRLKQSIVCVVFTAAFTVAACGDSSGENTTSAGPTTGPEQTSSTTGVGDTTSGPQPTSGPEPTSGTTGPDPTDGTTGTNPEDPAVYEQCKADAAEAAKHTDVQCQCLVASGEFMDMASCVAAYGEPAEVSECTCKVFGKNPETKDTLDCTNEPTATFYQCFAAAACDVAAQDACGSAYFDGVFECPALSKGVQNEIAIECQGAPPFMCTSGEQVPEAYKCDFEEDCSDGSDEVGCMNGFQCTSGATIPLDYKCDGSLDCCEGDPECRDVSDEADCPVFMCKDGDTVPAQFKCNGEENCLDGSDEVGCPVFMCMSGETVPASAECDGFPDCEDSSDEKGCPVFMCGSGEEIAVIFKCDGVDDCKDG